LGEWGEEEKPGDGVFMAGELEALLVGSTPRAFGGAWCCGVRVGVVGWTGDAKRRRGRAGSSTLAGPVAATVVGCVPGPRVRPFQLGWAWSWRVWLMPS
jgi:hypothetical protein